MKTREVFRLVRGIVEPPLAAVGFSHVKEATGQFLVWSRPQKPRKHETVYCQIGKWEWDPWFGSSFRVGMTRSLRRGDVALCREWVTMFDLLTKKEKREVQDLQNQVIAKIRLPSKAEYNAFMGFPAYSATMMEEYRAKRLAVKYSGAAYVDLWLQITDRDDVNGWGQYLAAWLPRMLSRVAEVDLSALGSG